MRRFSSTYFVDSLLYFSNFVSYVCGQMEYKYVQIKWTITTTYTHFTQRRIKRLFSCQLYSSFYSVYSHGLHTLIMHFTSVTVQFYTLYTGPTITTTYNIFKKGSSI